MCGVYPASDVKTAGDEISSTYEGRHITLRDDELLHKYTGATDDGFVDKGDAVIICKAGNGVYGKAVGVALNGGAASADLIAVDTEGIWALLVYADNDAGGSEVVPGDELFIDCVTAQEGAAGVGIGCISKRRNVVTQIPFGYALGNIDSEGEGVIAVKVHFDPTLLSEQDLYAIFESGHGADNARLIKVTDNDINAGGMSRGLAIEYSSTAVKTGTSQINGISIDMDIADDVIDWRFLTMYCPAVADKNIEWFCGLEMYFEDLGNDVAEFVCIDIGRNCPHAPAGRDSIMRVREHDTVQADSSFLLLEGGANALGYLVNFTEAAGVADAAVILDADVGAETCSHRIRVRIPGADKYIYLYPV